MTTIVVSKILDHVDVLKLVILLPPVKIAFNDLTNVCYTTLFEAEHASTYNLVSAINCM